MNCFEMFSLDSKIALVTGAARGNGRAIAKGLSEAGASVVGIDIIGKSWELDEKNLEYYLCDITDDEQVSKMIEFVLNKYNKIDL